MITLVCAITCLCILSTQQKLYFAEGHKEGNDSFEHGFLDGFFDRPQWWPDLTVPSVMR